MKKVIVGLLVVALVLTGVVGCAKAEKVEEPEWQWYVNPELDFSDPGLPDNFAVWDWGTLLPDEEPRILETELLEVVIRGDFSEGSIVTAPMGADKKCGSIFKPEVGWIPRVVEIFPDHVVITIPEDQTQDLLTDCRKLANGNYTIARLGRDVCEMEPGTGKFIRRIEPPYSVTHEAYQLPSGNLFLVHAPSQVAYETTWGGTVIWEWRVTDEVLEYSEANYSGYKYHSSTEPLNRITRTKGDETYMYLHLNAAQDIGDGHHLIELKSANLVIELDENDEVIWSFGPLVLKQPHCARRLPNGNTLIHDSGGARCLEVTPDHQIVWQFTSGQVSAHHGTVQRLPNGDTLITDTFRSCIFAVTPEGKVRWEIIIKAKDELAVSKEEAAANELPTQPGLRIYRAWWYPS